MRLILSALMMLSAACQAHAANVTFETKAAPEYGKNCIVSHVSLDGDIVKGDFQKIKDAFAEADSVTSAKKSSCNVNESGEKSLKYISLNSNGGDYMEAIDILDWMKEDSRTISTYVDRNSVCYSACAIIFLGGSVPGVEDQTFLRRSIDPKAKLGFHAPFPILDDRNYSDKEVMDYFHQAFFIEHGFFERSKKLGLPLEVSQLLMQPTNDALYMIDTVGRAFLLNATVQSRFTFFSSADTAYIVDGKTAINICVNNELLRSYGQIEEFSKFSTWLKDNKLRSTFHFTPTSDGTRILPMTLAAVVPVEYAGEGMYQSCVVSIPVPDGQKPKSTKVVPKCVGLFFDDFELGSKIERGGVDSLDGGDKSFCRADGPLAGLPFDKKLVELTPAELGE
ncbi:hypothetical protein [Pleomorphomonas carboxyditropha]|uniref:Uncharacterized protein n=1 Tax=Pleomorphomonas carboxyditropha TaxID=2023338 RepID=A0A2G9X140_9HYPH|nr:hypothetical protein [Pleomorphomonas carboxyditropha]PIP00688.1 hypothetical protein CJ014_00865 [Pleomorphomonas carboxyditropha]